jgi:ribosomal protein S18 acetylase RimI-like enzyme
MSDLTVPYATRPLAPEDEPFLWEMLYHAAHMEQDGASSADAAKNHPYLAKYVRDWGRDGDLGFAALESLHRRPIGAAWVRLLRGEQRNYLQIDETVPELAIAVLPAYANQGVGTGLLNELVAAASSVYPAIVLSVRADNPARRLYERLGFVVVDEVVNRVGGRSFVMLLEFRKESERDGHGEGSSSPKPHPTHHKQEDRNVNRTDTDQPDRKGLAVDRPERRRSLADPARSA